MDSSLTSFCHKHLWLMTIVLFLFLNSVANADVILTKKGIQVDSFPEGFDDVERYNRHEDGTLELGPWSQKSAVIYRFYLPPACGDNDIDSLTITIQGKGELDKIKIGTHTAALWYDLENTNSFSWPDNPEHLSLSISDILDQSNDSLQTRYLEVRAEVTKASSNYELNNITLQFSYSNVSDTVVYYFLDSYGAFVNIQNASPFLYGLWETTTLSELGFWLGVNYCLIAAITDTFQSSIGKLIGLGLNELFDLQSIFDITLDSFWFTINNSYYKIHKEYIKRSSESCYVACQSLALGWKAALDGWDDNEIQIILSSIDSTKKYLWDNPGSLIARLGDAALFLYGIYEKRWPPTGDGTRASSREGDLMAEIMLRSFSTLLAYEFDQHTQPIAAQDSFLYKFYESLESQQALLETLLPPDAVPGNDFFITGYNWDEDIIDGDGDLVMEAGETVFLKAMLQSRASTEPVHAYLTTYDPEVKIIEDYVDYDAFNAGESQWPKRWHEISLDFTLDKPNIRLSNFVLSVIYVKDNIIYGQDLPFNKKFLWPGNHGDFEVLEYTVDDVTPTNHRNNGDNIFQSSEEVHIRPLLKLKDDSSIPQATDINTTLLYNGTELAIPSNYYRTYADMIPGNSWYPENDRYFRIESKKWNFAGTVNLDLQVDWHEGGPIVLYDAIQITVEPAPIILLDHLNYDFGTSPQNVDVTHTMRVNNTGSGIMNVLDVSCIYNDTTVPPDDRVFTLEPGAYRDIKVTIDTDKIESGTTISREVEVESDGRIADLFPPSNRVVITGIVTEKVIPDPINSPPVLQAIGNKSVDENVTLTFTVNATDPEGETITYLAQDLPSGATFINQTFSWTPGYDQAGSYRVTFKASDGNSQDSETITITVNNVNRAPVLGGNR